jgi:hypothetical protein
VSDPLRPLLDALAVPRRTGTPGNARVRAAITTALVERGFTVTEQRFRASDRPMRLVAMAGGVVALVGIAAGIRGGGGPGAGRLALGVAVVAAIAAGLSALRSVASVEGVNLVGRRGDNPAAWLVAHYDSKGQALSMAGRLVAVAGAVIGGMALALAGIAALAGRSPPPVVWLVAAVPAVLGGYGVLAAGWRDDSPGAVDNASGVLAAIAIADALPRHVAIGIACPDAEELGLQGARALARSAELRGAAVINLDGIDDRGAVRVIAHRAGPVGAAVGKALGARLRRWLPVVVDGGALAPGSGEAVTILKGDWGTMRVVHTPRDAPRRLSLSGVRAVAAAVAAALAAPPPRA